MDAATRVLIFVGDEIIWSTRLLASRFPVTGMELYLNPANGRNGQTMECGQTFSRVECLVIRKIFDRELFHL